jgi:hypothetical protein
MPKRPLGVLSLGVFIVVMAISASLLATAILHSILEVFSLAFLLFGLWVIVLAGIRASNPEMYGHGTFSIFSGGILIATLGSVSFLYLRGLLTEYLLTVLLFVIGALIVVAGIRVWRK